jgi:hypothetical protein
MLKKVAKKYGLLLQFSEKIPKVNNHPLGENSPNLVTLLQESECTQTKCMESTYVAMCTEVCVRVGVAFSKNYDHLLLFQSPTFQAKIF